METNAESSLVAIVRRRVDRGALPTVHPDRMWTCPGGSENCSACDGIIEPAQGLCEFDWNGHTYRFHGACYGVWTGELIDRGLYELKSLDPCHPPSAAPRDDAESPRAMAIIARSMVVAAVVVGLFLDGWDVVVMALFAVLGIALLLVFRCEEQDIRRPVPLERFRHTDLLRPTLVVMFFVSVFAALMVERLLAHGLRWRHW